MGAAVLAVPLFSSAAVINGGVSASGGTGGVMASPPGVVSVPVMPSILCYPFNRLLSVGASGSDVTALQNFLAAQRYFTVAPTGYFGAITRAAVGRWQAQNGVAAQGNSGNGIFGPLSRSFFIRSCGGNGGGGTGTGSTSTALSFSANPQFGSAPLTVQFIESAPQGTTLGNAVNFGDGTTGNLGFVPVCSNCNAEGVVSHTYAATGTYNATLTSGNCSCPRTASAIAPRF